MIFTLLLIASLIVFVVVPVIDSWPASRVWIMYYWYKFTTWLTDGDGWGGDQDGD